MNPWVQRISGLYRTHGSRSGRRGFRSALIHPFNHHCIKYFILFIHPFFYPSILSSFLSFHSSFLWHNYKNVNPRFGTSFIRLYTKQEILFLIFKKNTKVKQKSNVIHILVRQIIIMFP